MHIYLGADHAGFEAKEAIKKHLLESGYEVTDCGAYTYDANDDYPAFCIAAGEAVISDPGSLGFVLGGSGNGEQIAANKVKGIRCALGWNEDTARLARAHNNAQMLSIGARQHSEEEVLALVDAFLDEPWSEEDRHQRRIDILDQFQETGVVPD